MKVSKLKTLLYCLGASTLITTLSVDAASLSVTKLNETTEKNVAKYEVYLDATDGEVSNLTITFSASNPSIKPQIRKADNVDAVCNSEEGACALQGSYSTKIKVAEVTLENSTPNSIDDLTLSVSSTGIGNVSSDPISLVAKEEVTTTQKVLSAKSELTNLTVSVDAAVIEPAFNENERNYTITGLKDTVNSITFSPTCENCKTEFVCIENCTVSEAKNNRIMLEDGANTLKLTTTSEDGKSTTEYNFTVYRGEVEEPSAYLEKLSIKDIELSPEFDMLLNDYSINVDLDVESLEIKYELEDPEAKVDIKGADKLEEGENTVTITVTSSDGKSKQVYTITVNKEDICNPDEEDCNDKEEVKETVVIEKKKPNKIWLIVLIVVGALTIIGISGFLIFKKKKKNNKDDKNNKNNKSGKSEKIKNMIIEPDEETTNEEVIEKEEIIKPRVKPSVDDALNDLMKTKEIELNNL